MGEAGTLDGTEDRRVQRGGQARPVSSRAGADFRVAKALCRLVERDEESCAGWRDPSPPVRIGRADTAPPSPARS